MNAVTFDTLAVARRLKAAGSSEDQAEAVTGVLREVRDADLSTLVTRTDLSAEIGLARTELKSEIGDAKNALHREIAEAKFEVVKWVLSAIGFQTLVIVGAVIALAKLLH